MSISYHSHVKRHSRIITFAGLPVFGKKETSYSVINFAVTILMTQLAKKRSEHAELS